ncbi:MAG: hypothetical protein L6R40_006937 [Gallowayella cf. fulva]|nr:MAG: hypothetical protein L6R40_006937 [Xanthomendoza cf. fulva]
MPTDDYISVTGGGLRLKGVNPSSKISKHKKKRPKHAETEKPQSPSRNPDIEGPKAKAQELNDDTPDKTVSRKTESEDLDGREESECPVQPRGKTEAELRHEERRRRRLEERLKREGTKTHKEKVEEFNHYLSNLSEHHDMPRIGPG